MSDLSVVTYALCKKYTRDSLIGLGAIKGAPCQVQSVTPVYSTLDPTVVVTNKITLSWEANDGSKTQTTFFTLDEGKGIHDITWDHSDTSFHYYEIHFYDGTTEPLQIPVSSGQLKRKIVPTVPDPDTADDSTFYLVPISTKPGSYAQYIRVSTGNPARPWEMLFIGNTDVDMTDYQLRIDTNIIKSYKNYDATTMYEKPTAPNVVGAINTFEKEIGATYSDATSEITNLNTLHKDTLVNAVNEIGYLPDLEMYDAVTGTPDNLVDAINLANKDYEVVKNTTIDRTKHIDTYKVVKDAGNGSPVVQAGVTVELPRVDIKLNSTPTSDANYKDYRTYNLFMGNELLDANDTSNTPFGTIHVPEIKLAKKTPTDTQPKTETFTVTAADWSTTAPYTTVLHLSATPYSITSVLNGTTALVYTVSGKDVTITAAAPDAMTIEVKYEVQTLSAQYYLSIEGKDYSQLLCGETIDIAKDNLLKDIIIVKNTADNDPVPGLLKDEKAIAFIFEDAAGVEKTTYLPVKDLLKAYEGINGIKVDDTLDPQTSYISIQIYDPDTLEALKADTNGLQVMKATETQYGVVKYATNAEVLAPASTIEKSVRPIDLYSFVTESDSVKGDIGTLYVDPDTSEIVNNTITKAISELSTIKVEKKSEAVTDAKNISEFVLEDIPKTGVKNFLGDAIEIPKSILQVEQLTTIVDPKPYILYYLTQREEPYEEGLYEYVDPNWIKVAGGNAITVVETLPVAPDPIYDDRFYLIVNKDVVVNRYSLSDTAKEAGYTLQADGIHFGTTTVSYEAVMLDWLDWEGDELVEDPNGILWMVSKDGGTRLEYGYQEFDNKLYYHNSDVWYLVCPPNRITMEDIYDLYIED